MNLKIVSWNINGLRSVLGYQPWGFEKSDEKRMEKLLSSFNADILCFQETKLTRTELNEKLAKLKDYYAFWSFCRKRKGYSGVVTYVRKSLCPTDYQEGFSGFLETNSLFSRTIGEDHLLEEFSTDEILELEQEGRCCVIAFGKLLIFNFYFPNSGDGEERYQFKLRYHQAVSKQIEALHREGYQVIVLGDINAFPFKIDCAYKQNEESMKRPHRVWFRELLSHHMIDTFREIHKEEKHCYTCFDTKTGARATNYGTRIDYILCSKHINVVQSSIMGNVIGSDHVPASAELSFPSALPLGTKCTSASEFFVEYQGGKQKTLFSFFSKGSKKRKRTDEPPKPKKRVKQGKLNFAVVKKAKISSAVKKRKRCLPQVKQKQRNSGPTFL